jgi:F0F1-type ATP synthase membrane subunit b/b'
VDKSVEDAINKIEEEKRMMIAEAKEEIAGLVMLATEKIINEKVDEEKDREIINSVVK